MLEATIVTRDSLIDIGAKSRHNPKRHRRGRMDGDTRAQNNQNPSIDSGVTKPWSTRVATSTKPHGPCHLPDANGSITRLANRDHVGNLVSGGYCN
jgi:hypothetical protein